jgi:hypothetical protein
MGPLGELVVGATIKALCVGEVLGSHPRASLLGHWL